MKIFIILLSTINLVSANTIEDLLKDLPESNVWLSMSSGESADKHKNTMSMAIDQGQILSAVTKKYLDWSLRTYTPIKLDEKLFQELEKIDSSVKIPSLIGNIGIEPRDTKYIYMISKSSQLSIFKIVKLGERVLIDADTNLSSRKTIEEATYYWPNGERILLEIAARMWTDSHGNEGYIKSRELSWKQFEE